MKLFFFIQTWYKIKNPEQTFISIQDFWKLILIIYSNACSALCITGGNKDHAGLL